jgi:hypothetical protein
MDPHITKRIVALTRPRICSGHTCCRSVSCATLNTALPNQLTNAPAG